LSWIAVVAPDGATLLRLLKSESATRSVLPTYCDGELHAIWLHANNDDRFVPVNIGRPFNLEQNVIREIELFEAIQKRLPARLNATGSRGA